MWNPKAVVTITQKGVNAVQQLNTAPVENELVDVLQYLMNDVSSGRDIAGHIAYQLNWTTEGRTDFSREFNKLKRGKYVTIGK